ncbi:hypothetical protein D9M71_685150 [compost metagenome]
MVRIVQPCREAPPLVIAEHGIIVRIGLLRGVIAPMPAHVHDIEGQRAPAKRVIPLAVFRLGAYRRARIVGVLVLVIGLARAIKHVARQGQID